MSTARVAAIDCGTNSIRLLVADVDSETLTLTDIDRRMEIVRLGEGVDRTGQLSVAALDRTFAACDQFAEAIQAHGVAATRFVATSASRDAANRDVFVAGVRSRLGVEPEVISGDTEAALSFLGATRSLGDMLADRTVLVVDIGGGSTEFVLGTVRGGVSAARSVDIGCVRLTERRLAADPPTAAEITAAVGDIDAAITQAGEVVDLSAAEVLVGLAGSVTTLAAIWLAIESYDPMATHRAQLPAGQVAAFTERLLAMPRSARAAIPVLHPGRVDVIGAGALILDRIMATTGVSSVLVSEHDILDGIAWSLVS